MEDVAFVPVAVRPACAFQGNSALEVDAGPQALLVSLLLRRFAALRNWLANPNIKNALRKISSEVLMFGGLLFKQRRFRYNGAIDPDGPLHQV